MNKPHDHHGNSRDDAFDQRLRELHAQAVERLPGRTLLRLQSQTRRRSNAPRSALRRSAWPMAATCAICLVVAGLLLRHPAAPTATAPVTNTTNRQADDAYTALDESPELYVWLASKDTDSLALE